MELLSRLRLEDNLLVISVHDPATTESRAVLSREIELLLAEHRPAGLVIALEPQAGTAAAVSTVLRVWRRCADEGLPVTVATQVPAVRHLIHANQPSLPVHTHTDGALRAARTLIHH
ncbi:hypothetical protein [Streptomyces erythrochromogenes]|uniref:hypothetical protein n=1 Tax=Streptomyces erythrochromogenes TaxID=285574 RepID=UPI0036AD979D